MGTCVGRLCRGQHTKQQIQCRRYALCRCNHASHHARSLILYTPYRRYAWLGTLPVDTGGVVAVLIGCGANHISVHKGNIWFLVATVAQVPPAVR